MPRRTGDGVLSRHQRPDRLVWENHEHHQLVRHWMTATTARGSRSWATCTVTELGFLRLSANPRAIENAVSPSAAQSLLGQLVSHPKHVFWNDDTGPLAALAEAAHLRGYRQVTDAYLLGLARRHAGKLATLDRGLLALAPPGTAARAALELLESRET